LLAHHGDPDDIFFYASEVANGFRPPFNQGVPAKVQEVLNACWAPYPADRPSMRSVIEMLEEYQRTLEDEQPNSGGRCCSVM
jgi:hypothetical protein